MTIHNEPLLTQIYEDHTDFQPLADSSYVGLHGIEERSRHFASLRRTQNDVLFCEVVREGQCDFDILFAGDSNTHTFGLRSSKRLAEIWRKDSRNTIYLDITGLRHHIWIPLLRSALAEDKSVKVVYVEPDSYKASSTPTEGQIYDLSERISGLSPIPGFAALSRVGDDFLFLPLLGFEGTRVAYLLEHVQPIDDKIIPVVGLPGFRPEHPFSTYLGNRIALQESNAWQRVRFADANCPFSLFYLLDQIAREHAGLHLKIALVGTKPHALGAVLFVLQELNCRELIYDHPIRKSERTSGVSRLLEYDVSAFAKQ